AIVPMVVRREGGEERLALLFARELAHREAERARSAEREAGRWIAERELLFEQHRGGHPQAAPAELLGDRDHPEPQRVRRLANVGRDGAQLLEVTYARAEHARELRDRALHQLLLFGRLERDHAPPPSGKRFTCETFAW